MRKSTTWVLVVGCAAMAGTGTTRAQDAAPPSTTRGSFVVAAGDKVHGFLRGGETHAMRVHLAKGDVYSFSVNSMKRGDMLLMHLSLLDPNGREINGDARVDHRDNGKKITVGPFKAPATGTYTMELSAQGWFQGDYWATSSVRGARITRVVVPTDGNTVDVDVSAGATLRLRAKSVLSSFVMATPNSPASQVAGNDPLVASLLDSGLSASETGTYRFGAPGTKGRLTIEVAKPRWTSKTVEAPKLPYDASLAAQFEWINGWKQDNARAFDQAQQIQLQLQAAALPPIVAAPVAVDAPTSASGRGTRLFIGGDVNAAGSIVNYTTASTTTALPLPPAPPAPPPPATPTTPPVPARPSDPASGLPPLPGPPTRVTDGGTPTGLPSSVKLPTLTCPSAIGTSMFCLTSGTGGLSGGWRDTPWTRAPKSYPEDVHDAVLPRVSFAFEGRATPAPEDPELSVRRTFQLISMPDGCRKAGNVSTVSQYFVDGHPVAALLATGGDTTITWTVSGTGVVDDHDFTVEGVWTLAMRGSGDANVKFPCTLSGSEKFHADTTTESIVIDNLELQPVGNRWYRPVGTVTMTLDAPEFGIYQTMVDTFVPTPIDDPAKNPDRFLTIFTKIVTVDPTTPAEGVEQDDQYDYTLTCS